MLMMTKKMIFSIVLGFVAVLLPLTVEAQVAKQVVVTKAYVPEVSEAVKLPIEPNMVDTVKMRPEIDYSITPQMYATDLATHRFKPATVTYWEFDRTKNFYAKVGAGYALNTIGDIYASTMNTRVGYLMAYLNHLGQFGERENYAHKKVNAMQMQNRVGVAGGLYCGKRMLEGDVNYNSEIYHRFAGDGSQIDVEDINFKLRFGDNFTDLSRVNFDVSLYGNFFNDKAGWLAENQQRLQETHAGVKARVAREFKRHYVEIGIGYDGRWGMHDLADYADNMASLGLMYGYKTDNMEIMLGADYCYDRLKATSEASNYLLPKAKVRLNVGKRNVATPFFEVNSSVESNSYHSLLQRNPYLAFDANQNSIPNSVNYDLRLGIEGRFAKDKFAYRLYMGGLFTPKSIYWYNLDYMWMHLHVDKRNVGSLNLEMDYKPTNRLEFSAGLHGYIYSKAPKLLVGGGSPMTLLGGRPSMEAYFKARYNFGKISVGLSADFCSRREWNLCYTVQTIDTEGSEGTEGTVDTPTTPTTNYQSFTAPFYADVSLDVDWQVAKQCTLFLEGHNLANMKIYRWAYYNDLGIHFTVGARVNF